MQHSSLCLILLALWLVGISCSDTASQDTVSDSKGAVRDSKAIEGLWSGSWGGGESDGMVFQPVIAELLIEGDRVELHGFPNVGKLTGNVRIDPIARQMQIAPTAKTDGQPAPKAIDYEYELKGNALTLIDSRRIAISLEKVHVAQDPLGNARVELVAAAGINDAQDLIVTEFHVLRAGLPDVLPDPAARDIGLCSVSP